MQDIRNRFERAENEEDFVWIIETPLKETKQYDRNIIEAYRAVSIAARAQYPFNPYTKWQYFTQGRDKLEECLKRQRDVESVFLRLVVQLSVPSFVGYTDNIEEDLDYVYANIVSSNIPVTIKKFIVQTIIETENKHYDLNSLSLLPIDSNIIN